MSQAGRPRPPVPPGPSPHDLFPLRFLPATLLVGAGFVLLALPFAAHTIDDAWITFRYSRNWASGLGPYFNAGEHVEGYSNFLLMGLLTPVAALAGPGAVEPAAKAIGLASALLSILGAAVLARRAAQGAFWEVAAGVVAAGLVACAPGFPYHAMSGLETSLYAALLTWGVVGLSGASARAVVLGGLSLAAAALTRPEGPLMFALGWTAAFALRSLPLGIARNPNASPDEKPATSDVRALWIAAAIGAMAIAGQIAFRLAAYDGELLPNTFYAKTGGSGNRFVYVFDALKHGLLREPGLILAAFGLAWGSRLSRTLGLATIVGLAGALLPLVMGSDWMLGSRFVVPYLPLLATSAVLGWGSLLSRLFRVRGGLLRTGMLLIALPLSLLAGTGERGRLARSAAAENEGSRTGHAALASWLQQQAHPGDTVLLMDIGQVGYRCIEQRILDVTGLTDRHVARSPGTFLDKDFDLAYVFDQQPRFIVLSFLARGMGDEPYDPRAPLHPFSAMERRIASHPEFVQHYPRVPTAPPASTDALEQIRILLGAEAIFPYAPLGPRYLMAVYQRH